MAIRNGNGAGFGQASPFPTPFAKLEYTPKLVTNPHPNHDYIRSLPSQYEQEGYHLTDTISIVWQLFWQYNSPCKACEPFTWVPIVSLGLWKCMLLRCFKISWRWASWIISVYLCFLKFVAVAHDYPSSPLTYACEDVDNYYHHVEHFKGEPLKRKLNSIIAKHRSLSYKEVWDALKILDAADVDKPEASSGIVEIYSLRVVSKRLAGKPKGWNREHLWPRSYGLTDGPSLTDLHNIRPADVNVNSSRGNKYYGECHVNSTKCLKPANKEAAPDTETDRERWAPPVQVRGDIARALMYMAVSYGFHQPGGGLDLRLSDSPSIENRAMGLLSTLLRWNDIDPPSREEKLRNERICKIYQHNRNPFIDHPEYAKLIWRQTI